MRKIYPGTMRRNEYNGITYSNYVIVNESENDDKSITDIILEYENGDRMEELIVLHKCCLCSVEYESNDDIDEYCPDCISYINNSSQQNEEFYI